MADRIKPGNGRMRKLFTQARLKEILHYDPASGIFTWIDTRCHRIKNGDRAGTIVLRNGKKYRTINVDHVPTYEHQLAWLYVTGEWVYQIDHWDRDGLNNKLANLRSCSSSENKANATTPSHNTSGFKGVSWCENQKKWRATISKDRRIYYIGVFDDPAVGHSAYLDKARELYGEFARSE